MGQLQLRWMEIALPDEIVVKPFTPTGVLSSISITIILKNPNAETTISADDLEAYLAKTHSGLMFATNELFAFGYKGFQYCGEVTSLDVVDPKTMDQEHNFGMMAEVSVVRLTKGSGKLKFIPSAKRYSSHLPSRVRSQKDDLGPPQMLFWRPTSSSRTWGLEVWIRNSVLSSGVPSHPECSHLAWSKSLGSNMSRASCCMAPPEQGRR